MTANAGMLTFYVPHTSLRQCTAVIAIVVAMHVALFSAWRMQPPSASMPRHDMEVTMAVAPAVQAAPAQRPHKPEVTPEPLPLEPVAQTVETPVALTSTPNPVVAAVLDTKAMEEEAPVVEPEYKASYLNNPPPPYPLAARRMGMQGKVVLNVEVLAEGVSGQVNVQQSSGHNMLDDAALRTVKSWRFIPARQAGRTITRWFRIPIQFSLKDKQE